MHDLPDNSKAPPKHFLHVIREFLKEEHGIDDPQVARDLMDDLHEAGWEIIASHIMDMVIASGGVDPIKLTEANNVGK